MTKNTIFLSGLAALLLIAPLYSQQNIGGTGLALTFNIPIWISAAWMIAVGFIIAVRDKTFIYPRHWLYVAIFPIFIVFGAFLVDNASPTTWLFRQLYIIAGFLFLIALFQYRVKQRTLDGVLLVIAIALLLQSILGILQAFEVDTLYWLTPETAVGIPNGNFQQVNVYASFVVTGLMTNIYFISRPSFAKASKITGSIVLVSSVLAIYVMSVSGSRVGLLSLVLSLPLIIWSRYKQLKQRKYILLLIFVFGLIAMLMGQTGIEKTLEKTAEITQNSYDSYSAARLSMYAIGLEIIAKEPIWGHGIGSFLKVWTEQATSFYLRNPHANLPLNTGHPHNEILFWMIEGGVLALVGIVAFIIGICFSLYQCGLERGGAYAAMLLPISLHTQVELPFYVSSLHWFLWIFIIFLILRHQTQDIRLRLSNVMGLLTQSLSVVCAIFATIFMVNTALAQSDIYDFLYKKHSNRPYLQKALNNAYFRETAKKLAMRSNLYASIEKDNREEVITFITWSNEYMKSRPELKMYEDLISASIYLNPEGKGCDMIESALASYAHNKSLQQAYKRRCE